MCLFYGWHFSCSLIDNLCGDWCECHTNSYSVASPPPFGLPVCGVPFQTGKIHCWIVKRLTRRLNSQFQNVREWEPINDCRVCVRQLRAMSLLSQLGHFVEHHHVTSRALHTAHGDIWWSRCVCFNLPYVQWKCLYLISIRPKSRQVNQLIHFAPFKLTKLTASPPSVRPRDSFESRFGECVWCCCCELRTSKRSNACRPQAAIKSKPMWCNWV